MKRVGFLLKVKEDKIDEYKKHHEAGLAGNAGRPTPHRLA